MESSTQLLLQELEQAIRHEDATAVTLAIRRGANPDCAIPSGDLPMVLAVKMRSFAMIAALRQHPISKAQWEAAATAAANDPEIASIIAARHDPVPKPLGTE